MWFIAAVLHYALRAYARRALVGLVVGALVASLLPSSPSSRAHLAALLVGLGAPWLVLGRDAARRRDGFREALRTSRRAGRLVLLELLPPLGVLAVAVALMAAGVSGVTLALFAWGAAGVTAADALDRRATHAGAAWAAVATATLALYTAPWWLAPLMGCGLGHWPATLGFGLHPAATALVGGGRAALQDNFFYTWTLSGLVDARPLPASVGIVFHFALAAGGAIFATFAARRPTRSLT